MVTHGALVGWQHHDFGDGRIVLLIQTRQDSNEPGHIDTLATLMTTGQATVLGNFLFQVSGQTPPSARQRGWWRRLFG
jgi:hypothetical protein